MSAAHGDADDAVAKLRALRERAAAEREAMAVAWADLARPLAIGDRVVRGTAILRAHPALGVAVGLLLGFAARGIRRRVRDIWWLPAATGLAVRLLRAWARPGR